MALTFAPAEKPEWASDAQWAAVLAVEKHGSARAAERALGVSNDAIGAPWRRYQKLAATHGHAPGHFNDGVAPGFGIEKVTVQRIDRDENGKLIGQRWERQHREEVRLDAIIRRCDERLADFARFEPVPPPPSVASADKFTNFLGLFDLHIGEKISSEDPAGRWDIATAKRTIMAAVVAATEAAPKAKRIVVCFGGDAAHYDGLSPVTPRSRHVLHSDGDFDDMIDAVQDVAIFALDHALEHYEEVYCIWAEGNHDEAGSAVMRKMLAKLYRHEPRLTVVQSRAPYYALLFGKTMICVHHGHGSKLESLAGKFANLFREMWGRAVYAYAHAGHQHHIHAKEKDGLVAMQHPALPPSDDYALSKALISRRACQMVTYHDDFGEWCVHTIRPERLGVFDVEEISLAA